MRSMTSLRDKPLNNRINLKVSYPIKKRVPLKKSKHTLKYYKQSEKILNPRKRYNKLNLKPK
jgi:hypothetical protein